MNGRIGRGSLTGTWPARTVDRLPNLRGIITIERDLPAGTRLWLSGWTRPGPAGGEFISLAVELAGKGGHRRRRSVGGRDEPEGRFSDAHEPGHDGRLEPQYRE